MAENNLSVEEIKNNIQHELVYIHETNRKIIAELTALHKLTGGKLPAKIEKAIESMAPLMQLLGKSANEKLTELEEKLSDDTNGSVSDEEPHGGLPDEEPHGKSPSPIY